MIATRFRFHGHNSVRTVYRRGRPTRNALGSLHSFSDSRVKKSRMAVVVSRKVSKSAVVRNRIRRRIYELVRPRLPALNPPAQLVFTVYQTEAATMPAAELEALVNDLLGHAGFSDHPK